MTRQAFTNFPTAVHDGFLSKSAFQALHKNVNASFLRMRKSFFEMGPGLIIFKSNRTY